MNKIKVLALLVVLLVSLTVVSASSAMRSAQYAIDRSVVGAGGASMSSASYRLGSTAGQPAIGGAASANYRVCAGYWCGIDVGVYTIYIPLVMRDV